MSYTLYLCVLVCVYQSVCLLVCVTFFVDTVQMISQDIRLLLSFCPILYLDVHYALFVCVRMIVHACVCVYVIHTVVAHLYYFSESPNMTL